MAALTEAASGDAPALHRLLTDPEVAAWLRPHGVSGPFTPAECAEMVDHGVAHWRAHGFGYWLAWDGDECVGRGLLEHSIVDGRGEVEIGWAVARTHWGRGIATDLGRHALRVAAEHGLRSIVAFTRVENLASRRVMEKLGMRHESDFTHAGYPHVRYRIHPAGVTSPSERPERSPPR